MNEVELTKRLIKINSTNPGKYESEVFNPIKKILNDNKINYKNYNLHKNRPNIFFKVGNSKSKDNILFIGHLDTVPFGKKKWKLDPLSGKIINNKIYGRGSTDMKAGIASMLSAIIEKKDHQFKNRNIIMAIVSGEETGCEGSILLSKKLKNEKISMIVCAEPTDNYPVLGHKGVLWLDVEVKGKTSHGSSPELGSNSIYSAIDAINKLKNLKFNYKKKYFTNSTINIGKMNSGENINSVPDLANFTLDLRTLAPNQFYKKHISNILSEKKFSIKELVNLEMVYNDTWKKKSNLNIINNICSIIKRRFKPTFANYFTDIAPFQKGFNKPFNLILGPGNITMAHQTDEYVEIKKLNQSKEIYKFLINEYC